MLKSFQVFIIFFSFIQTGLAQKNSELKIYSVGDYQIEINLPKSWYPMSPEKIATIAKESELQRIRQGTFDYVSTTSFAELENNPISSLIGSYAIVDSAQKILIQSQLDSLLEKTGNSFKDQFPDMKIDTSETKLKTGDLSYRVFNIHMEYSEDNQLFYKYYCAFFKNMFVAFEVTTIINKDQKEILKSIKGAHFHLRTAADMVNLNHQTTSETDGQKAAEKRKKKIRHRSYSFNGQNLTFVPYLSYRKTNKKDYDEDKSRKNNGRYSQTVFFYQSLFGNYKCNAFVWLPTDTAMTAKNYMVTFEESMKDEFNNAELQPKYERNDVTINGRDYCGGIMVFDLEFMKTYVYVYCTKVENVVYEFTFMTFRQKDLEPLIKSMESIIIEPSMSKK